MFSKRRAPLDPDLQQIDDLERDMVRAREQTWKFNNVSAEEIARELPAVVALAKQVCDQLRSEHRARMPR